MNETAGSRYRFSLRFLLLVTTVTALALAAWKPLLVRYHVWGLERASARAFAASSDPNKKAYFRDYEAHLTALVRLDYYEKKTFAFRRLKGGSPESRDLLASLQEYNSKLPPADRHSSSMTGYSPTNDHGITIWAKADHMENLAAIIESYDPAEAEGAGGSPPRGPAL